MVDLSRVNWRRNQPIVLYLRRCIGLCLPQITRVGGYNNRTTSRGTFSFHSEGRAADIHLDANVADEKAIGDGLFRIFREYHDELGVDHVIWDRRIWSADRGGPRDYDGSPHRDHVHVAFTREGSQREPSLLIPLLDGIHIRQFGNMAFEPSSG